MDNIEALKAALNGHEVTDDHGDVTEETTPVVEPAAQETSTAPEPEVQEEAQTTPKVEPDSEELAEDDAGKRYVPQERFDKVYGKSKALERELEQLRQGQGTQPTLQPTPPQPMQTTDKASALETELLYATLPQFRPDAEEYNPALDQLGAQIYKGSMVYDQKAKGMVPTITKLEAARKAIAQAKEFTKDQLKIAAEARQVKSLQADQGITSRVTSRGEAVQPDPNKMSLEQMEEFLKSNGQW